ncbi:MAG: SPOR domain-containing protein [Deltaproteobacteria bacterium]|nr:SPOR domain-containing protein [Deltaproteobacteria bacterium]
MIVAGWSVISLFSHGDSRVVPDRLVPKPDPKPDPGTRQAPQPEVSGVPGELVPAEVIGLPGVLDGVEDRDAEVSEPTDVGEGGSEDAAYGDALLDGDGDAGTSTVAGRREDLTYSLQIRAFPTEEEAERFASSSSVAVALGDLPIALVRSEVEGKGVWFRVRVGRFVSAKAAESARARLGEIAEGAIVVVNR